MNIRFEAKHAPFIWTPGAKKTSKNSTIFPPILGVKWGGDMKNVEKNELMLEYLDQCGRNLGPT
jgi:hypothetical protein